ncbi:hypothetical protein Poli38472_009860 [Pythium oligandrum]|uniref:Uncharacterized protein n=1 Tax=Pythium oligandrum TaxID=41045 RepID=A0A8K1CHT2_PYTOL|nr:hypothetical protein Poli38472_009860 [Pythium oligandrum]|eukprot:TMW62367.1 hypothetical protein Poli38472_009860 [Pythium oligandrum]
MLSKRKSLNDDLIIWHGMTKQNISIAVRAGLPFTVRRRKIWLDIVQAEVQKKSKSIVAQNFAFSTRMTHADVSAVSNGSTHEEDNSFVNTPIETRVEEIVDALPQDLPIHVDSYNTAIVHHLTSIIATEMKTNAEATKILAFVLYREQIGSNRRPCIPTGSEACSIYRDVLESCINQRCPSIYRHMLTLDIRRDVVWEIFQVGISDLLPLVLRVRIVDMLLVQGCVVLVSVMLTYLVWRQDALIQSNSAAQFVKCLKDEHKVWLKDDDLEAFWARCVELHSPSFLSAYINQIALLRIKSVALARHRKRGVPLLQQFQQEIFTHQHYSWIGFDVDHTLVEYKLPVLLKTSFEAAVKELQQSFIGLRAIPPANWISEIAQRGIAVDTNRGNFLHIAEDGSILRAYHGSHEVSYFSIKLLYGMYSKKDLSASSSRIIYLSTAADLIYAPVYAWIVDAFDSGSIAAEEMGASLYLVPQLGDQELENPNDPFLANRLAYISLSTFALKAARTYYANGFWKTICSSPETLIQPNLEIREVLDTLKEDNHKQLFILTNGSWTHCNEVLKCAIGRDWEEYFEIVLTDAKKDIFFDELNDTEFVEVDPANPFRGSKRGVRLLEKGKVYSGGNVRTLMRFFNETKGDLTGVVLPPRICYFGDHIMHDVLLPARNTSNWDLIAVIKEIQTMYQPTEKSLDESSSWLLQWVASWLTRESPTRVTPDLYSSFFFLGRNGTASCMGKRVLDAATLCIPSVGRLARSQAVLQLYMIQQGMSRYSTSSEIKSLSKRVSAKVRAVTKEMRLNQSQQSRRSSAASRRGSNR